MRGRFRPRSRQAQGGTISRCQVPRILPQLLSDVDNGLIAAGAFIRRLLRAEGSVFGRSGQNAGMATLTQAMGQCVDWSRLTTELPTAADLRAFGVLAHGLMPFLWWNEHKCVELWSYENETMQIPTLAAVLSCFSRALS